MKCKLFCRPSSFFLSAIVISFGLHCPFVSAQELLESTNLEIQVNPTAANADDNNDGTPESPLKTFKAALDLARKTLIGERAATIILHPGVYYGNNDFSFEAALASHTSLTIRAFEKGTAVLSDASIADNDWRFRSGSIYSCILDKPPDVLLVDGKLLVKPVELLPEGAPRYFSRFLPKRKRLFVQLPEGWDPRELSVEVVNRDGPPILSCVNLPQVEIEGVVFRQSRGAFALNIDQCQTVILKSCTFEWNGGRSFRVANGSSFLLKQSETKSNREGDFHIEGFNNASLQGSRSTFNAWLDPEGTNEKALFPATIARSQNISVSYHRFSENHATGFYLEECANIHCNNIFAAENRRLAIEVKDCSQGIAFEGCEVMLNHLGGFLIQNSSTRLEGNIIYGNGTHKLRGSSIPSQITVLSDGVASSSTLTQEMKENMIIGITDEGYVFRLNSAKIQFNNDKNLLYSPSEKVAIIRESTEEEASSVSLDFDSWQVATKSDLGSFFGDPLFLKPRSYEIDLHPKSPWFRQSSWPVRELE